MRVPLEHAPVLSDLAHGEFAADVPAALVLSELETALFVHPGGVVFTSVAIQGYGTLVLPTVLRGLAPELGHAVMELTADLLRFAPALGGFPLLTSGGF